MEEPISVLKLSLQSFTAEQLEIKVHNSSGALLDKTLVIELYPPSYLVSAAINEAAKKAPANKKPVSSMRLDGIVTCPAGWSVWARRETSDSSLIIVLINDVDQNTGDFLETPVTLAENAEFTIRIPLNREANRANIELLYAYLHGTGELDRKDGKLELKASDMSAEPDVTLKTDCKTPTMVKPTDVVKVIWHVKDGVSATLRGPLPGGNTELTLSTSPDEIHKIGDGWLEVRVVGPMTYVLQAEVKQPGGKPNLQVVRMLSFDTSNHKYSYIDTRPDKVLPNGLVEIDWAAWGVREVQLVVGGNTTRVIRLTQQTLGRFYEGTGVMRVSASKTPTGEEVVAILASPVKKETTSIIVISWEKMIKPEISTPYGMAVLAPYLAVMTMEGLYIAQVGHFDPTPSLKKLIFTKKEVATSSTEWIALTAADNRFLGLRRTDPSPDLEVAPFTPDGKPDAIPPVSLPADLRMMMPYTKAVIDFVGCGKRAYVAVEPPMRGSTGTGRRAYSVGFDSATKKADVRPEPLLEALVGYRLVSFDDALYALNREDGRMFRFELTTAGRLGPAMQAASAVTRGQDGTGPAQSMIKEGMIVPVGHVLVVLSPNAVPSLAELEQYGLHNVLGYVNAAPPPDTSNVPQDLFYNPQKNYWGRCGHDLDVKQDAVAAFRGGDSPRLWVIQPDGETNTLAVGSESLFAHDYVVDFPTKSLLPYLNRKRKFTIKCPIAVGPINEPYRKFGIADVSSSGPREVSPLPTRAVVQFDVEVGYNQANPEPVTLRVQMARRPQTRPDVDHIVEVTFSGPDLSSASSCVRRVAAGQSSLVANDEVVGSRMQHSTDGVIEVPRPARFDDNFRFVIVNASEQFRIKIDSPRVGFNYILEEAAFGFNQEFSDFTLKFEGKIQTQGVIGVNLNFALPNGIEALPGTQRQTKLIRLNTQNAQNIQVLLVKVLMPGDTALQLKGSRQLIEPMADRPVFVCHLDYKM
jgi:hypothetical protein